MLTRLRHPGRRPGVARCPARWTWASRPGASSPSSRSSSTAAWPARSASRSAQVAQSLRPAFAGIDAGDWVDPAGRDARRHGAARAGGAGADRSTWSSCRSSMPGPSRRLRSPCRWARWPRSVRGSGPRRSTTSNRETVVNVQANVQGRSLTEVTRGHQRPAGQPGAAASARLPDHPGRRGARPGGGVHPDLHRAGRRGAADVSDPRGPVRLVPRSAGDPDLAAAVADRRGAGAVRHPATRSTS